MLYFRPLPQKNFIAKFVKSLLHKYYSLNHHLIIDKELFAKNGLLFSKSRYSFNFIIKELSIQKKGKIKILFPNFFCYEVINDFDSEFCDLIYFEMDEDRKPNFESINIICKENNNIDAIYVVDFFGVESDLNILRNFKNKYNLYLFFDKTHSIFPTHELLDNEFVLLSFYKHLAIAEGAGVYFNTVRNVYKETILLLNDLFLEKYYQLDINKNKRILDIYWALKSIYVLLTRKIIYVPNDYTRVDFSQEQIAEGKHLRKAVTYYTLATINQFYSNTSLAKKSLNKTFDFYELLSQIIMIKYKCSVINKKFKNSHLYSIKFNKKTDAENVISKLQKLKLPIVIWPERKYINSFGNIVSIDIIKRDIDSTVHLCVYAFNNLIEGKEREILTKLKYEFN